MPQRKPFPALGTVPIGPHVRQQRGIKAGIIDEKKLTKYDWRKITFWAIFVIIIIIGVSILIWAIVEGVKKEDFAGVYDHWSKELQELKEKHQIGKPSGLLSYIPRQTSCHSSSNLFVQPNVTFRPHRRKNGCTFIDMKYPG